MSFECSMEEIYRAGTSLVIFGACAVAAIVEASRHTQYESKMKRGVPVWAESLPAGLRVALDQFGEDVLDRHGRFVRKQDNVVLVHGAYR